MILIVSDKPENIYFLLILLEKVMLLIYLQKKQSSRLQECEEKETLVNGKIYFAPADYNLQLEKDRTASLDYSEKVNYSKPSINITFKVYQKFKSKI